jgi:Recombination endonuclease VII
MIARKCSVEDCNAAAISRGWCQSHYRRWMKYGRLDRIRHTNRETKCTYPGCDFTAVSKGYCGPHYKTVARQDPRNARANKQYSLWHDRKARDLLCPEWLDFFTFIRDIGERPSPRHALTRKHAGLYGPNNFQWREHLRRREGESKKDWYARKWQTRQRANPGWDRPRDLLRKYGITITQYDAMLKEQKGVCAICQNPETRFEFKTGNTCALAVDHCHDTSKVRGLLCSRCNKTIGAVGDSVELLQAMQAYLQRHQDKEPPS